MRAIREEDLKNTYRSSIGILEERGHLGGAILTHRNRFKGFPWIKLAEEIFHSQDIQNIW